MASTEKNESNLFGILGVCLGWWPILGVIFGIISLARKEKTPALGIIALVEAAVFFMFGISYLLA